MDTIQHLTWRYATKSYDPSKKLTDEQRNLIMEALRLAPSSFGLQPWKFIHVADSATREKLKAAAWGQSPITDASDLFVLCAMTKMDAADVDRYIQSISATRGVPAEALNGYRDMVIGSSARRSEREIIDWNAHQVYIALGFGLAAAAANGIDSTPMEGFDPKQFDEILGLKELGVTSTVLLAVGFRSADDKAQNEKKVRYGRDEVVVEK